jgi:filamentous hemagglutinin family protein
VSAKALLLCMLGALEGAAQAQLPSTPSVPLGGGTPTFQVDGSPPLIALPAVPLTAIDGSGTKLSVGLNDARTVINWAGGFNVGSGNEVDFSDTRPIGSGDVAVLNRDVSGNASSIMGRLTSSGGSSSSNVGVYLLNGSGILFGPGARVDVGALVASTLNLDAAGEQAFLRGSSVLRFAGEGIVTVSGNGAERADLTTVRGTTGLGQLILLGSQVNTTGYTSQTAGNHAAFVSGTDIEVADMNGLLSFTIMAGTPIPTAITADGVIDARNVTLAFASRSDVVGAFLSIGGVVNATTAQVTDRGIVLAAGTDATGVMLAGGAFGPYSTIDATRMTSPIYSAADVELRSSNYIAFNSPIFGRDVALSGLTVQGFGTEIRARDDIAVDAALSFQISRLTSGTKVGTLDPVDVIGAVDGLLPARDFTGHDIQVGAGTIATSVVRAYGAGSDAQLFASGTCVRLCSGFVNLRGELDLDVGAHGNIDIRGITSARDVALAAGGSIATGSVDASDDIAMIAGGSVAVSNITAGSDRYAGFAQDNFGAADALLPGIDLAGKDLIISSNGISGATFEAYIGNRFIAPGTDAGSDVRLYAGSGLISNAGEPGESNLYIAADRNIEVRGLTAARNVSLNAFRNEIVTDDIRARDDIAIGSPDNPARSVFVGALSSGTTVGQLGPTSPDDAYQRLLIPGHDIEINSDSISVGSVRAYGSDARSDVRLSSPAGGLIGGIGLAGEGDLDILASGSISLAGKARGRDVALRGSEVIAPDLQARDDVAIRSARISVTAITGATIGSLAPIDVVGAADYLAGEELSGSRLVSIAP